MKNIAKVLLMTALMTITPPFFAQTTESQETTTVKTEQKEEKKGGVSIPLIIGIALVVLFVCNKKGRSNLSSSKSNDMGPMI